MIINGIEIVIQLTLNLCDWNAFRTGLEGGIPDPDEGSRRNAAQARLRSDALPLLIPQPVSDFFFLFFHSNLFYLITLDDNNHQSN